VIITTIVANVIELIAAQIIFYFIVVTNVEHAFIYVKFFIKILSATIGGNTSKK